MGKILILANNDIGLYKFRKELIEELLINNEVYISLPDGELVRELAKMGCKFYETKISRRGMNPFIDFNLILHYNKIIKSIKPSLVITYTIKPNLYGGLISVIRNIDYVANITGLGTSFHREGLLKKFIIFFYRISLKGSKVVFFENEENMNTFINNKIIVSEKARKLNGAGVNLIEYPFTTYPDESEPIRFLFIGRLMKEKGIEELLNVAEEVKRLDKSIQFDIVGPYEDEYFKRINSLHEKKIINYYGYQKDVKPFIQRSHCFVLPSYHEGMANTLLECGAMGRPIITSDIPGCREAVIEGFNGILVCPNNEKTLYDGIVKFINLSYEFKVEYGKNSRKHIEKNFDRNDVVNSTIKIINHQ